MWYRDVHTLIFIRLPFYNFNSMNCGGNFCHYENTLNFFSDWCQHRPQYHLWWTFQESFRFRSWFTRARLPPGWHIPHVLSQYDRERCGDIRGNGCRRSIYRGESCVHKRLDILYRELTHLPLDKMAAFSQTTFSNAFSWMKSFTFWFEFHWNWFLRVQSALVQVMVCRRTGDKPLSEPVLV